MPLQQVIHELNLSASFRAVQRQFSVQLGDRLSFQ